MKNFIANKVHFSKRVEFVSIKVELDLRTGCHGDFQHHNYTSTSSFVLITFEHSNIIQC